MRLHLYKFTKILFFSLAILFFQGSRLAGQARYELPPNQPEQDACGALQLCGGIFYTPYTYIGAGLKSDLDGTPCSGQPGNGETNSVWLQVHTASAGIIVFKIIPVDPQDDYNFAVVNITGKSCSALSSGDVVRCNYNNNIPGSNLNGIIGLSDTSIMPYVQEGTFGESFNEPVYSKADEVYLILINNNGNYVSGAPGKGFTIDFTGSSSFYNIATPQLTHVDVPCTNANNITVKTSTNILCSSIAPDGSDFTISTPGKITRASGQNCSIAGGYTNTILINFSSVLPPGNYQLGAKTGSDGNSLTGFCNNELSSPSTAVPFIVKANGKAAVDNEIACPQQLPYTWNGIQVNTGGDSVATYTTVSASGCDSTAILNLLVSQNAKQVSLAQTICDGDSYVLPWDSVVTTAGTYIHRFTNIFGCDSIIESVVLKVFIPEGGNVQARDSTIQTGFCLNGYVQLLPTPDLVSYLWNTGQTTNSITVGIAGSYNVVAQDRYGCTTIDTFVVALYKYPTPRFNRLENLCNDTFITLDAGPSSTYYLWSDGSNSQTLTTNEAGTFWVTLTTSDNCTITDSVTVAALPTPGNFLNHHVSKCSFNTVTLAPSGNFSNYMWSNGSKEKSIDVSVPGLYWLAATSDNGCMGKDSINVIDSLCPEYFYMPNAFSPNNDHVNDVFRPTFSGHISGYHLSIYNQWGKLVFSTSDPHKGWDGTVGGFYQLTGVYVWICSYSLDAHVTHNTKGIVVLLE
jgi:gliding motility-associated-like protein